MNKVQIIETFNKHFMEFIMDIERVFPEDTEIVSTRRTISKSFILMPKAMIRMFNDLFVVMYSKEIDEGNLDFFIENDYRTKHGYKPTDDAYIIDKIDVLRAPVRNMSDEEKSKVVQYLKNLKKLSDMYNSMRKGNK